jgi:DNA (cytosine-5)-methyltransferase 1
MKYGSVCSGIEAATHAWHPLGWEASFFSEIEKFPRQVLVHHYPNTPLHGVAHAFKVRGGCEGSGKGYLGSDEQAFTLSTGADQQLFHKMQVRRLMPIECERLQGFRDDFTNIPGASDSTRYKALGNSMAVPVMKWIGERINLVESLQKELALQQIIG